MGWFLCGCIFKFSHEVMSIGGYTLGKNKLNGRASLPNSASYPLPPTGNQFRPKKDSRLRKDGGQNCASLHWIPCDDLFCTTPRLRQNTMTPVALQGRGQLAPITVFHLQVCSSNLKFLLVSKEARPRPHICSTGALCLATLIPMGGSSDKHGYISFIILAKWEWQVEDLCHPDNATC